MAGLPISVTQAGAACNAVFSTSSGRVPAAGGSGTANFTLPSGCSATPVSSDPSWLTATVPAAGTLSYTAAANSTSFGRSARITLGGATFVVSQSGAECTYNLTPTSRTIAAAASSGTIQISTPAGCGWSAVSDLPVTSQWLRVSGAASGAGNGTINYLVDANPSVGQRIGTITVGARTFTVVQRGTALSMACAASATPNEIREGGVTELTADVNLSCTNVPPAGVTSDIELTLSSTVTSRLTNLAGTATEALAILNGAANPVNLTSGWEAGLAGPNALRWKNVQIVPNAQGQATIRLTNIRVSAPSAAAAVTALVGFRSTLQIPVTNASLQVATSRDGLTANGGPVTSGPGANQSTLPVIFREQIANGFRNRSVESGFFTATFAGGQADTGTRLRVQLPIPSGVRVLAPVWSQGGEFARLVSADTNGNGGGDVPVSGNGYVELTRVGSTVTATWEVKASTGALDTLVFPLIIEGLTVAQVQGLTANMQAGFAPLSNALTALPGVTIPRFADTSVFVPPADLRIISRSVAIGGPSLSPSSKEARLLAVASSVAANYDVYNTSSEPASTVVVRSSAPAGFRFTPGGTTAEGSTSIAYTSDNTEAQITYDDMPPSSTRSLRLQMSGAREPGDYIEMVTTVESRSRDLDLSDNRTAVGLITESCPVNTISPTSQVFTASAGQGQFNIGSSCADWTVRSSDDWVTIDTARAGTGSFTVRYSVQANQTPFQRTTTIIAAGQTYTVTQQPGSGEGCTYTVTPPVLTFAAPGETRQLYVQSSCGWAPVVTAGFPIQAAVEGGGTPTGNRTLLVTLGANAGAARSGTIDIGNAKVTINQNGGCPTTLNPSAVFVPENGGSTTIFVTAGCAWESFTTSGWIRALKFPGAIALSVDPNFKSTQRTGFLHIGSATLTIAQAAASGTETERLVRLLFFQLFGRAALPGDLSTFVPGMQADRAGTVTALFNALETDQRSKFISRLYRGLLKRPPEYGGWIFQRNAMANNEGSGPEKVRDDLITNFVNSEEFRLNFGQPDNAEFVRIVYRQMLGREASQPEVDFQVGAMGCPTARCVNKQVEMARNSILTPEVTGRLDGGLVALLVYHALLLREAHPADMEGLEQRLKQGTTLRQIIADVVSGPEFEQLFK